MEGANENILVALGQFRPDAQLAPVRILVV